MPTFIFLITLTKLEKKISGSKDRIGEQSLHHAIFTGSGTGFEVCAMGEKKKQ